MSVTAPIRAGGVANRPLLSRQATRLATRYSARVLVRILLWLLLGFFLLPILWIITSSLKDRVELYQTAPHLLVFRPTLENFTFALRKLPTFPILYRNSLIVTLGSVALQTIVATLAGYGFARVQFRGRDLIFYSMILLIFVPRAGGLIAQYELMSFLGLRDNLLGLILAFSAGLAVPVFIMRQAFLVLPREFEDQAMIDGCNRFQAFRLVMVPMATGAMVVVALFEFIRVWGEYLFTLTMIDDAQKYTLGIGLVQQFASATIEFGEFTSYGGQSAAYIMGAAPAVIFFVALQRWFVRGLLAGLKF
jgi:ABC-type glycerol-3-phosphate transport system permease component